MTCFQNEKLMMTICAISSIQSRFKIKETDNQAEPNIIFEKITMSLNKIWIENEFPRKISNHTLIAIFSNGTP